MYQGSLTCDFNCTILNKSMCAVASINNVLSDGLFYTETSQRDHSH